MRNIQYIFTILLTSTCFSQTTVKFIDSKTGNPIYNFYSNIYKNGNTFQDCGASNKQGYKKIKILNIDSVATYHLSVSRLRYKPIWQKIDLTKLDTLIIKIEDNPYYISETNNLLTQECNEYSFIDYYPREPRNLDDLPENISKKVCTYLKNRVGLKNYYDYNLIGGQIIEIGEYLKRHPDSNQKTAYYLCFAYRNIKSGISMYSSKIELDEDGNILNDISFPKTKNVNKKIKLISLSKITKKEIRRGVFKKDTTKISMEYLADENILVWKFENETYSKNNNFKVENSFYNAHTGKFLKNETSNGFWIQ